MKLKFDADGHVVLLDGKPVYVHEDGKEVAFDAPGTVATISRLNGEAKAFRLRAEDAEGKLKPYVDAGIEDPVAAVKALGVVKNLDAKKLVDAGEVDRVVKDATKVWEGRLAEEQKRAKELETTLYNEMIGGAFSRSKFIAEKMAIPADLVQSMWGSKFGIEKGSIYATDDHGNKLLSRARPGEVADPDEALEILVSQYKFKDSILKGSGASGGGSQNGGGKSVPGGKKAITRAEFNAMDPMGQSRKIGEGFEVVE